MPSARYNTAVKYIEAFNNLDLKSIMSLRAPKCTHQMAPASLGYGDPITNDVYETSISRFGRYISAWPVEIKEVTEDEKNNRVVVWATAQPQWREEAMDGPKEDWEKGGEYMFTMCMDESGEKLVRVVEFLDSKRTEELRALIARASKNLEKKE
ncbi:uncharacterized protein LY89DRAFT_689999 [Mollisia scopiformis]|uniref:SnoaL-like domain-containing protein n=1 Tax=Mollisia scopiformis TaxID=149040 RepID=A0A132BCP9_MOLSC|nr:uncharacterized protein LY89DRAFT_689999 [Mollisia scopiformis]KUJ10195.1 hypothetical protein LY89DRAFT_689999 [Mollisia scopiformis]